MNLVSNPAFREAKCAVPMSAQGYEGGTLTVPGLVVAGSADPDPRFWTNGHEGRPTGHGRGGCIG